MGSSTGTLAGRLALAVLGALAVATPALGQEARSVSGAGAVAFQGRDDAAAILLRYARAWRGQEEMAYADTLLVGFDISGQGGGSFHIVLPPEGPAQLHEGAPSTPVATFVTDIELLRRLDRGEINAFTAMGRAKASDPTPLDVRFPPGFRWTPQVQALYLPFAFHFWNREWPEVTPFGKSFSRQVHGGNAVIFYYDRGLRTGWYQVEEGMHLNEDPSDQVNPFPSLFIVTRGAFQARLGGVVRTVREGEAVFAPRGMPHEFWAEAGQGGEFIIIMFGEGA